MASSASSLCIRFLLLFSIGLKASARGTDPHKQLLHRVRSITISSPTYLLYLRQIYVKDIGFGNPRYLPLCCGLIKGSLAFRLRFRLKLLSDSSLAMLDRAVPSFRVNARAPVNLVVSSDTLAVLPINSLLSGL
jgi:hypothetical protein